MRIQFWSIGKPSEKYIEEGVSIFTKRISNYFPVSWKIIPPLRNSASLNENDLRKKEGEMLMKMLQDADYLVALDENGKSQHSTELALFLQHRANESVRELIFIIGGAYGIDNSILKRANFVWSLSPLTFPHQLVRLILSEQVYRACTIMRNERYHHG
jgi:23S rRNA (pseudouridine1915-N3)-methyltransferase